MSQLQLPGSVPLLSTRQQLSLASLTYLVSCLLISNSTCLRNNFRKPLFKKFHLGVSLGPTSCWVKPPECLEGKSGIARCPRQFLFIDAPLRGGEGVGPKVPIFVPYRKWRA